MVLAALNLAKDEQGLDMSILAKEIESWQAMAYAMRKEDRELFEKMVSEVQKYADAAANSKGEFFSAECLFMALIFEQQKMIMTLLKRMGWTGMLYLLLCRAYRSSEQ